MLLIQLKRKDIDPQNIACVAKLFGQKLLMVLDADGEQRLALWQTRLIMNAWTRPDALRVELGGLNLDQAWVRMVTSIAGIPMDAHASLDVQLENSAQCEKTAKEITRLEKLAWAERQPRKKMELAQRISTLKKSLEVKAYEQA